MNHLPSMKIHYLTDENKALYKDNGGIKTEGSSGFDLVTIETIRLNAFELTLIHFGIVIKPPSGFHTVLMPRSSTFKKWGLVQVNGIGLIDADYCGKGDELMMPVMHIPKNVTRIHDSIEIPMGTPIGQIKMELKHSFNLVEFDPEGESRGGFGSTDDEIFQHAETFES